MRALIEIAHLAVGLLATALITQAAIWAYPLERETLGWIGWLSAVAVIGFGIKPIARAWAIDRGRAARHGR